VVGVGIGEWCDPGGSVSERGGGITEAEEHQRAD
jgi:hypothetical protein